VDEYSIFRVFTGIEYGIFEEKTAQGWTNRTLAVLERTSVHFLVLPGSLLSITEISEYRYFSPSKPIGEFNNKSE